MFRYCWVQWLGKKEPSLKTRVFRIWTLSDHTVPRLQPTSSRIAMAPKSTHCGIGHGLENQIAPKTRNKRAIKAKWPPISRATGSCQADRLAATIDAPLPSRSRAVIWCHMTSTTPEAITLGDVLRITEPDVALVGCMAGEWCLLTAHCNVPMALDRALQTFLEVADQQTLADTLPSNKAVHAD